MATNNAITVVICTCAEKRFADILAAVRSVQHQTLKAMEIIVVVDHNPRLFQQIKHHLHALTVIRNRETQGLAGARNTGWRAAKTELVAFLDDDAIAPPNWLKQLVEAFHDPDVMAAGGSVYPLWPLKQPSWFPEEFLWVVGCTYKGLPTTVSPIESLIGANMAFRLEVLHMLDGFRCCMNYMGSIPSGCEETELCLRARQRYPSKKILYLPQALVLHRIPDARTTWHFFSTRCLDEGISKAHAVRASGSQYALSTARVAMIHFLLQAMWREFGQGLGKQRLSSLLRAWAMLGGILCTGWGFISGMLQTKQLRYLSTISQKQPLYLNR